MTNQLYIYIICICDKIEKEEDNYSQSMKSMWRRGHFNYSINKQILHRLKPIVLFSRSLQGCHLVLFCSDHKLINI